METIKITQKNIEKALGKYAYMSRQKMDDCKRMTYIAEKEYSVKVAPDQMYVIWCMGESLWPDVPSDEESLNYEVGCALEFFMDTVFR